ncbi:tetratricopeptide repeat-containing hybrid sensor histidine kinase/response regulator [Flavobacterium limnophilum]|uniref:tetratricopeptide repeat-containing hybrid sensor histidine kinase/response regulator n=1 Tax=Flavobacterium limnophilum TaxID=3003262 RepID=UPI0024831D26|nr:response regulator [Flavobacterium limnophilum]
MKIFILLFLLLNSFSNYSFAQTKTPSKAEIKKLAKKAVADLNNADFEESISTSRQVLHYATKIGDNYLIAVSYNTIAANLDQISEYDKAIFYYNKGLSHANKTNNNSIKNFINNNLGNVYCFEKKQYTKGINYYKKSLEYSQKDADTSQIVFTKLNIAWAYFDIGQFEKGYPYLEFLNKYNAKFGAESTNVIQNMLNGMYYGHKGENPKAESYFLKAIALGKSGDQKSDLSYSHQEYSKFLLKNKDYKKAYENLDLYNKITEHLYNDEKINKADIAGVHLELDEYKREVDKIEIEKNLQAQSLKKSRIIVVLFILALNVLLLLLYSLYKNYKFKKKANKELTLANQELLIAKEKAEEASLLKTQFVSTMSHELRTPLYGVIGITNMLLDEHKELANSPHLSSLKFSARYLLSLVNDILHINKIEENRIVLENLAFNVSDEINMIKKSLSFIAQNNNDKIAVKVDPNIPEYLIGDKLRLSQILMNLVGNALKFTKNGKVIITANLVEVKNKSHYIEFKIEDNGIGIATVDQDKIFEKFVQVGRNDNDYQGTGLGLAIVKRLLTLFNSYITLESKVGVGTTFKFTIAFDHDPVKTKEIINNIKVDLSSSQIFKILVVEDNKINQTITKRIIEKNNCSCIMVDDGFQAMEILGKEVFDVVLMDINMPLMNGFETTRKIRLKGIKTPIIALTAFAKDEIIEEVISAGMNDIMVKPFEPLKLFKIINDQINKTRNAG